MMMPDTRALMTRAEFEYNVSHSGDFISLGSTFVEHLDALEIALPNGDSSVGDARYRFQGFSTPQRVIMMWCRVHGQLNNNGFNTFAQNTEYDLDLVKEMIRHLCWPDLSTRLDAAIDEYLSNPKNGDPPSVYHELAAWREVRPAFVTFLRKVGRPEWLWPSPKKIGLLRSLFPEEKLLMTWFMIAVNQRKFEAPGHPYFDHCWGRPPSKAKQKAFERWFSKDDVQTLSRGVVGAYIRLHRDDLCRITD